VETGNIRWRETSVKGRSTMRTMMKICVLLLLEDVVLGYQSEKRKQNLVVKAMSRKSGRMEEAKGMLVWFMVLSSTKNAPSGK